LHTVVQWKRVALAAAGLHLLLALAFSVIVPPWEAPDEWAHYKYVEYVARYKRLPLQNRRLTDEYAYDEATQPPLYYLMAAIPLLLGLPDEAYHPIVNPYATSGHGEGGLNMAVHDPRREGFPWRGTILALHLARLASILLGTLGLWFTWKLGRLLTPRSLVLPAVAVTFQALVPQYEFVGSVITNDILLAVLTGAVTYQLVKVVLEPVRWRAFFLLTLTLALAVLTKYLALALIPPVILLPSVALMRRQRGARRWAVPLLTTLILLLLSGGWLYRNVVQTGTLLPRDPYAVARLTGESPLALMRQMDWGSIPPALVYGFHTFWASFGWGNVDPGGWVIALFALLTLWGLLGWVREAYRHRLSAREIRAAAVILILASFVVALPLLRELLHGTRHLRGRYILGLLTGSSVLLGRGWLAWWPRRYYRQGAYGLLLGFTALNLYILFGVIRPTYQVQGRLSAAEAQAYMDRPGTHATYARFGRVAELRAYRLLSPQDVRVGDWVRVELLWHVLNPLPQSYVIGVHLLGRREISYGHMATIPAKGTYPTWLWQPDTWFHERYWLQVRPEGPLPTRGRIAVSLFRDTPQLTYIPVFDSKGRRAGSTVLLGRWRIAPATNTEPRQLPAPLCPTDATVGPARLLGSTFPSRAVLGQPLLLSLHWEGVRTFDRDATVFLHVRDRRGTVLAGGDGPPQEGDFPTTLWRPGDKIIDLHRIPLPATLPTGTYTLTTGLYTAADGRRFPAHGPGGKPLADNAVVVVRLHIDPGGRVILECPYPDSVEATSTP